MMLRPAVRSSVIAACSFGSSTSTTPPQLRAAVVPVQSRDRRSIRAGASAAARSRPASSANSTSSSAAGSPRTKASSVGRNMAMSRASPIIVASTSSTAIGASLTMCCAAAIASWKRAEVTGADRAPAEHRRQLQLDRGGERERAFGADQDVREIDVVSSRHQRVDVVAADAALHLGKARRDLVGLARAEREQIARQRAQRRIRRQVGEVGRDRTEMRLARRRPAARRSTSTFSRVLP